ncbi:PadR family transcriptional regulator [Streptomyces sp. 2A115]|uniref:PadR family transcriptional regulator n=1 Tax=Streptomyces sp. 2A115 TaxID=3457439 RepID=UPI003FD60629
MSSTRLFVLGTLAKGRPMHGHQIRRMAQLDRTELWTDIKPGSLYGVLHRMEAEGIITAVRSEQEGNRPERTVYAITDEGRTELRFLREKVLRDTKLRPDPIDLALQNAQDMSAEELRAILEDRRAAVAGQLESWRHLQSAAAPHIAGLERIIIRHTETRLRAELDWHDELLERLPEVLEEMAELARSAAESTG